MSEIKNKKEKNTQEDKQYAEMVDRREYREEVAAESKKTTRSWLLRNFPPKNSTTQTQSKSDDSGRNK